MTKQEYNDYIEALKGRGYQFGDSWYNNSYYSKVIEYRKDEDGNRRAVCQLVFNIYKMEFSSDDAYYSIVPVVVVTRNDDERLDFTIGSPKRSVEECEHLAKEFLRWVDNNINEYQENGR